MGTIYLTGDTHRDFNRFFYNKFEDEDYVIILGDSGLIWTDEIMNKYWIDWFEKKNYTVLIIDGNHECFPLLNKYPQKIWNGGKIHVLGKNIYHLMRGQIFNIAGHKIFTFGGARSIDRHVRINKVNWWAAEKPTRKERLDGLDNLEKHNNTVDYILTHECGTTIFNKLVQKFKFKAETYTLQKYFEQIYSTIKYKKWYFGHYHIDFSIVTKHHALYRSIIKLGDKPCN